MTAIPFVVGQWVRGDRFYGRGAQIDEILDGHRNSIWLLGTRRIGKTSLLKQIEYLTATAPRPRYFPVFWDFQGAGVPEELHLNFADALLDADERLERIGIELDEVTADDLFVSLGRLRRRLRANNLGLLLLCDEVEELIKLHRRDPALLGKLRRAMQSHEDIRSVLASTIRLWDLADHQEDTSPFLHGFTPPLYIERLTDEEARSLIEQSHLEPEHRPAFSKEAVEAIRDHCDNHPYLVQLVCKRYLETGDLPEAIDQVAGDRMVSYFFSVDFEMLTETERVTIGIIAGGSGGAGRSTGDPRSFGPERLNGTLLRLENLGFVRRDAERRFALANYFFRRWLEELQNRPAAPLPPLAAPVPTVSSEAARPAADEDKSVTGLFAEIKRRNVFRVGIAYLALAWMLLQVGDVVFDFLEVPAWAGKLLIGFLALGFPIALILAWAFELTPQGLRRDKDVDRSKSRPPKGRKLDFIIIAILAIAVLFFAFDKFL